MSAPTPSASGPGPVPSTDPGRARRWMAWVAAALLLAVAAAMVGIQWTQPRVEPWSSRELNEARQQLHAEPRNEALKARVRALDLELRQAYFRSLERNRTGAWLLLGAAVAVVLLGRGACARRDLGTPGPLAPGADPDRTRAVRRTQTVVVATGAVGAVALLVSGMSSRSHLPEAMASLTATGVAPGASGVAGAGGGGPAIPSHATSTAIAGPTADEWRRNWPQFRGPESANQASGEGLPLSWDVASGRGVLWRTNLPLPGYNSPIVWEDRVFLTGGDKKARLVFCFDAATGHLRWQKPVTPAAGAAVEPPDQSGAAASTAATDGRRVYAVFASGELGALDLEGNLAWHTKLDFSENGYGHASSLVLADGRLLVQADQGQSEDGKSKLIALEAATGKVLWTTPRPVGGSWASPLVTGGDSARVITVGDPWLMAHDLRTGDEVWRARVLGGELAPSPVAGPGIVIAVSPGHAFLAVKTDGTGDVTASHVAWKLEQEVPDVPTPVVAGELLFSVNTEGHLICRELATGKKLWDHPFETEFQASPLVAGDRLYLFSQPGKAFVVAIGREFRELAAFEMGGEVYASPAVAGGRMYVRTANALFAIGETPQPAQVAHARPR